MTTFQELLDTLEPSVRKVVKWCVLEDGLREIDLRRMIRDVSKEEQVGFFLDIAWDILRPSTSEHFLRHLFDGVLHPSLDSGSEDRALLERMGFFDPDGKIPTEIREHFYPKARFYFEQ